MAALSSVYFRVERHKRSVLSSSFRSRKCSCARLAILPNKFTVPVREIKLYGIRGHTGRTAVCNTTLQHATWTLLAIVTIRNVRLLTNDLPEPANAV